MQWLKVDLAEAIKHSVGKNIVLDATQLSSAVAMGLLPHDVEFTFNQRQRLGIAAAIDQVVVFDDSVAVAIETGYHYYSEDTGGKAWTQIWLWH